LLPAPPAKAQRVAEHVLEVKNATPRRFKGVFMTCRDRWRVSTWIAGKLRSFGRFTTALEAAHAYDQAMREAGLRVVNFPRDGTDKVQAFAGVSYAAELAPAVQPHRSGRRRRTSALPPPPPPLPDEHAAAATGGACATGADTQHCFWPGEPPAVDAQQHAPKLQARARTPERDAELPSLAVAPVAVVSSPHTAPLVARAAHIALHSPSASAGDLARCLPYAAAAAPLAVKEEEDAMMVASPLPPAPCFVVPPLAAAGPLQAGTAAMPLKVPPDGPASLVGQRVTCVFPEGVFTGAVVSTRATRSYGQLWCVAFEDGEEEELNWSELCAALQPPPTHAPVLPPAALPAALPAVAAAAPEGDADAAQDATLPPMAAFLRAITPPLSCLDAALAALPASGFSVGHLQCIAASSAHASSAHQKLLFDELTAGLGITRAADRFAFMHAVLALAPRAAATGCA
jgi:hypothetical protein